MLIKVHRPSIVPSFRPGPGPKIIPPLTGYPSEPHIWLLRGV
ncbi:hypothetical protein MTATph1_CDS0224 [Moorella phage MTATph1]